MDKYTGPCQRIENAVEYEGESDTNCCECTWNGPKNLEKRLENLEIRGRIETIQTTALLQSTRIVRRVLQT